MAKYRIPNRWKVVEILEELKTISIEMPRWRWMYLRRIGIIPEGSVREKMGRYYTDMQVEEIKAILMGQPQFQAEIMSSREPQPQAEETP